MRASRTDLIVEGVAGAAAAAATAAVLARLQAEDDAPKLPLRDRAVRGVVSFLVFRGVMSSTRILTRRLAVENLQRLR